MISKDNFFTHFEALFRHYSGDTWKNHKNLNRRQTGNLEMKS